MKYKKLTLSKTGEINFSITYAKAEVASRTNHNESHIHKECEIYINLSGDVSFEVENKIYPIKRGSVIITRPYEYHHCICHSDICHEHYWITFSADENEEFLDIFYDRKKGNNNLLLLNEDSLESISLLLESILRSDTDKLGEKISILSLFHILRNCKSFSYEEYNKSLLPDVLKALSFMDENLRENLNINSIAHTANVSVNTLERHFKSSLNISPSKMLTKKRLIQSLEYLRNGDTVTEAAIKSGISDYSNYIQLFKKQFGMTPLSYKKQFK